MAIWGIKERYKKARANEIRGSRGMWLGGGAPGINATVDYITFSTSGNATDFGDLTVARDLNSGGANFTRALCTGGGAPGVSDVMDYVTITSTGNFADFGNLTDARGYTAGMANNTRQVTTGGLDPSHSNIMDYVEIASTGNAVDFGDTTNVTALHTCQGSPTRGINAGGVHNPGSVTNLNIINFFQFATAGNATDFGDLTATQRSQSSFGSDTRMCMAGGQAPGTTKIEKIEIATTGNATDFAEAVAGTTENGRGTSDNLRGVWAHGGVSNVLDTKNIFDGGAAADFGDLTVARTAAHAVSNCHGGIDQDVIQRPSVTYMPGSGKTLICGGQLSPGSGTVDIDTYNIPTLGNARNFGDLRSQISNGIGCASSYTRAVFSSGYYFPGAPYYTAEMQAIEFATEGNVCDFGDTTQERYGHAYGNVGNTTRGLFVGGYAPGSPYIVNIIDYITIATMGNATDFGNLTNVKQAPAGASSNTRGLSLGGTTPSQINIIDYVTIASTGDASDFGDLTLSRSNCSGAASSVRAVAAGGGSPSNSDVIDYVTIASTGDASDFGDLTQAGKAACPGSNGTRAVFAGRHTPGKETTMDYITIASTGDAADFGDLKAAASEKGSASDSHGGLQT